MTLINTLTSINITIPLPSMNFSPIQLVIKSLTKKYIFKEMKVANAINTVLNCFAILVTSSSF